MHKFRFSEIASILGTAPLQQCSDPLIESLLTDSRRLLFPAQTIFFAISSASVDASGFIPALYGQGVRSFVVDAGFNKTRLDVLSEGNFLMVNDVVGALQALAAAHRRKFQYPVIGITGSNGKTIVKEWLAQLLADRYNIVRNPRSYNSQVGVPLSVWQMNDTHGLGIFEAGISLPGEMGKLQPIIDPTVGVISFIGNAHAEGFESQQHKIREKLLLFKNAEILIYNADLPDLDELVKSFQVSQNKSLKLFRWSRKVGADLFIHNILKENSGSLIHGIFRGNDFSFFIPFTDEASIQNAITCCSVLLCLGETVSTVAANMSELRPLEMRLELKQGINNCSIINDSYSADIDSLQIALDFLAQQQQHERRSLVLSDLLQAGMNDDLLYQKIASIINQKKLYRVIGIGPRISSHASLFTPSANNFFVNTTEELLQQLPAIHFHDETILLKGARIFRFEKVSRKLEQKLHETVLEINLNALRDNLKVYKQHLQKDVRMMVMVKAFSYGSGGFEIANVLQHAGVDYLAVAYADEGVELRKSGIRLPIMVMNAEVSGFDNIVQYKLEPELYSFQLLEAFAVYLQQHHIHSFPVHIKLDTGMHRLGFVPAEQQALSTALAAAPQLHVQSVFSHLVGSDDPQHDDFTKLQAERFLAMTTSIESGLGYKFLKHLVNTSGIHRHRQFQFDMVRLGIGLYGVDAGQVLQNVTTLRTTISQIKQIKKGESVGYSRRGIVSRDSTIATVRIGYADGYPRLLGNGAGQMYINGHLAPVIGNICMDMTMLDITGIPAAEGDEVIVFGEELSVTTLAHWAQTIPYEMLTNISQRVKRVYYEE